MIVRAFLIYSSNFNINRHSKQLIYETCILKFFNNFNSSVDYDFIFNHSFNFNATCDDKIPECILTLYTELIIVMVKLKNVFLDNFDY